MRYSSFYARLSSYCFARHVCVQCDHFFFLLEGEVQLARGGVVLGTLGEGSFVVGARAR